MSTDMTVISDVVHRKGGDRRRPCVVQSIFGGEDLVGNTCRCDRFLNGVFAFFTGEMPELDFGVRFDGR